MSPTGDEHDHDGAALLHDPDRAALLHDHDRAALLHDHDGAALLHYSDGAALLHYSEDPHIQRFVPHVPATNPDHPPAVWAIDAAHAPLYWFPRDCPRVTVWAGDDEQRRRLAELLSTNAARVQATELRWLARLRAAELYEYTLPAAPFRRWPDADGQWISELTVEPVTVRPAGDLLARHAAAGVELRLVPDLAPLRDVVVASGLPFSLVRMHNAARPAH